MDLVLPEYTQESTNQGTIKDPDITVSKICFPQDKQIMIHQSRVKCCPFNFSAGFYRYSSNQKAQEKWVKYLLGRCEGDDMSHTDNDEGVPNDSSDNVAQLEEMTEESAARLPVKMSRARSIVTGYSLISKHMAFW